MYGTVARYRVKPGMEEKLIAFEADVREAKLPGFVAEFTLHTDEDPDLPDPSDQSVSDYGGTQL